MGKRIVYTNADGNCCVVHPAYYDRTRPEGETEARLLVRVIAKAIPVGTPYATIDETAIPSDRTFRNAWEQDNNGHPRVNMPRARIIHMNRIRLVRDVELAALDVLFMRAVEAGDAAEQQRIAALKQVLRDIPATFDLSVYTTPNALKAAWPTELPPRIET